MALSHSSVTLAMSQRHICKNLKIIFWVRSPSLTSLLDSAQGAAQAIEDGATLGELFARIECKQQIKDILHMYEAIRKPRTTIVIARSNARREIYQLSDGVAQHERDRQLLQASSDSNYPEFMGSEAFEKWLFEYDVEVEVEKAWHQYSKQA